MGDLVKQEQIISWIFLAIALATQTKATDINGIIAVADRINHVVPSQKELQTSISFLIDKGLIVKQAKKYELTIIGKFEYNKASEKTNLLMSIWKNLEINFT
jgi:predicted transcriptional regulator